MADNVDNLVLELLRGMRSDLTDLRSETREGFREVRARLSAIERQLTGHTIDVVDLHSRYDKIIDRIERIEKRLELTSG